MEWQPIETAPMDGTEVLVYADEMIVSAYWESYGLSRGFWYGASRLNPTHWMPLPEPPNG